METGLVTFTSSYSIALDMLQETLAQANILPPLSAPEGRGQAYDKFLSIYHHLLDGGPQAGSSPGETLDKVA